MVTNIAQLTKVYQEIQTSLMQSYLITYHVSDDAEIRYLEIRDKNSLAQAKKRYSPAESEESSPIYIGGQQEAGYYKQTGGTDNGR